MYDIPPQQQSIYLQPNPLVDSYAEVEYIRPKIPSKLQSSQYYAYANQILENEQIQIGQSPQKKSTKRTQSNQMINNYTFSARNFGSVCDKIFMNTTSYHYQQKFGKKSTLVSTPLDDDIYQITQEQEPTLDSQIVDHFLSLPEDKRINYKKVHKLQFYGMIIQFKTLELSIRNHISKNKKPKPDEKKMLATLRIQFSDLLPLFNLFNLVEIIQIIKESINYNEERQRVEINLRDTLKNKTDFTPPNSDETLPLIKKFTVKFDNIQQKVDCTMKLPHILFYVNQFGYEQQQGIAIKDINELIATNFEKILSYLSQFNEKELIKYISGDINIEDLPEYKIAIEPDYSIKSPAALLRHTMIKQVFNVPEQNINNIVVLFHPYVIEFQKIQIGTEELYFEDPYFSLTLLNLLKVLVQANETKIPYVFKYQFETVEVDSSTKQGKNSKKKYVLSEMHQLPIVKEDILKFVKMNFQKTEINIDEDIQKIKDIQVKNGILQKFEKEVAQADGIKLFYNILPPKLEIHYANFLQSKYIELTQYQLSQIIQNKFQIKFVMT